MPKYEQAFRDVCSLADSKKIMDRKKCITTLKELLDSAEAIGELNANSRTKKGSGTNWTAIMHSVHKVLISAADKSLPVDERKASAVTAKSLRAKDTKDSVNRSNCSMTMLDTIKKANSSEILLNCDDLVSLVLQIFSSGKYVDYQKTYLNILINQILTVKQYQTDMESDHWKELLKLSISLYETVHPYIDKNLILEAICKIVQHGCTQSHLTLYLKKIFPLLVNVFNDAKSDRRNLSENTFNLANAICQAVGPESRAALCEFGETVLRTAVDLNSSCAKYDWILLIVRAHHPGGVTKNHDAFYACDSGEWDNILRSIYCMIIRDLKSEFASDSFVQLASAVSWQLKDDDTCIDDNIRLDESSYERPLKRRRTVIGIQGMIDVLTVAPLKEFKLSIQILISLMTQYPESINESNFHTLMEYLIDYLNTETKCRDEDIMDQLWELGRVMLQFETKILSNLIGNNEIKLAWEKIWSITLRSVSTNKYEERVHKLLQSLISHKKVIDSNAFLNLYLKDIVRWSKSSVQTLLIFCKHNIIQDCVGPTTQEIGFTWNNHVPVKVRLLKWVLAVPQDEWSAQFPIEDVCELLVGLTLKSWYNIDKSNIGNTLHQSRPEKSDTESDNDDSSSYKNLRYDLTDIESTHLMTEFEGSLCNEANANNTPHCKTVKDNVLYVKENRDLLIRNLIEKNTVISETEPKDFLIVQTTVIAKVFSNFKQLNIAPENINGSFGSIVKNSLQDISLSVDEIVKSKKKLKGNHLMNIMEALYLFYKTPYDNDIADIIRSATELSMLKNILQLIDIDYLHKADGELEMTDSNTSVAYIKNIDDLSDRHRLSKSKDQFQKTDSTSDINNVRMKACTILATFCGMVNGRAMSNVQQDLQIILLSPTNYDLTQIFDFRMAITVVESLTDCEVSSFSENVVNSLLKLLQHLCRRWYKDGEAARNILKILSKVLVHLDSVGNDIQRKNSLIILRIFHQTLEKNKYGPMVHIAFIQCLETIARIDPTFSWTKWPNAVAKPVVQELLMYIQSPFHIVRLKAGNCLHTLFASKDVNLEWLTHFFTNLKAMTISLFHVKGEPKEKVKEDERRNRTASALRVMAVVISCSAIFCSEALLFMFQLTVDKNVKSDIVKKVLERVSAALAIGSSNFFVENNLNYLLTYWLERKYTLHQFPIALVQCKTEQEFCHKYINVVVPILIQKGDLKGAQDLCNELGMSFKDVIEDCFPCLISWILPHISANPSLPPAGINVTDIQRATDAFNKLNLKQNEFQMVEKISTLLENNLECVILAMIKRLHDKEHSIRFSGISIDYPSSDPPHFKHEDIERGFKYLEDNIIGKKNSLLYLLATAKQHLLQKVLLNLKCSIHEVNSVEHKLKALHQYAYFSMIILKKIDEDYFDDTSAYVVRDVCHTMVYLVKESSDCISEAACSYFYYLLQLILPKRHTEITRNLRLIVASMIPIVKSGKTTCASDIMTFLIAKQNNVLGQAIERLDSFPMDEVFQQVRQIQCNLKQKIGKKQSLENEIQHFLNTRGENTEYCSPTELEHLQQQLSIKKIELREMYQSLESTHRFSEDCASSMLHQLICALVKLTTSSDPDVSLRAAKCLGEIGPADLSTMILQPERNQSKQLSDAMLLFTYKVVVLLSNLLIHPDVQLCTSTSKALYIIAASFWGQKLYIKKNLNDLNSLIEGSEEPLRIEYIRPFINKSNQLGDTNAIDKTKFDSCVNNNQELWIGKSNTSHSDWITNITCNILDCFNGSYLKNLIPVCRSNVSFCEKILPWIIHLVVQTEKKLNTKIYENINLFFDYHFSNSREVKLNLSMIGLPKNIYFNHKSVQCMLNVVDFIRSQSPDNCQFELNYLHIAKAAQYCSAYFTSVLYAELWCEKFLRECPRIDSSPIDYICETDSEDGKALQEILKEACIKIGDPDAIYGCGSSYFQNPSAKIEHLVQLRKWDKVLLAHDIELSLGNKTATKGLLDALQHSGLQYLLGAFVKTIDKREEDMDSNYRYECAWRLSDWNIPTTQEIMNSQQHSYVGVQNLVSDDYSLFHYHALKSFHEFDTDGLTSSLDNARVSIIQTLRNISLESCKTIYPALSQLQMLREIEEIYFAEPDTYDLMIKKWNSQDSIGVNDFEYIEPILSQRAILLQAKLGVDESSVIKNALADTYLQITELSKKDGYFQMAARALGSLAKQLQPSGELADILQHQEAMLSWMRGDQELGRHILRNLIVKQSLSPDIHAQALTVYGNWMAETKSENPQKVIEKYYSTALKCNKKIKNPTNNDKKNLLDTQAALAQFADTQYQQVLAYIKSPQFESFKKCIAYAEETVGKLFITSKDSDEKRAALISRKQSSNDTEELENIEREKNMYLLLALKHYIATLQQGEDHNLLMFRLVSLWLENSHHKELNELLKARLNELPSYKFVLLVPQLAPHMTNTEDIFSTQIYNLLKRCAIDHPHHTLPVLLSLMNLHKDYEFHKSKKKPTDEPRVLGAKKLIEGLKTTDIKPIILEMDKLAYSLIMLANFEPNVGTSKRFTVPNHAKSIMHIKNFKHTLVPTLSIDIKPSKNYDRVVSIQQFVSTFELVGGVNAPKKVTCIGTDGIKRSQLVKGRDDLRQDAVMQQVFTVMNMLLRTSKEANKRKLNVRTYKVVPLTQRCGILEWCDNTMPIGVILDGCGGHVGLHKKYYPKDYTPRECRERMGAVAKSSNEEKLRKFIDCCQHLHPVFHYFFLESFSSPEIWFERRLAYVHSVATTSIIGYILGLGDRHVNNILIDMARAEVIHIDFGIAFEQGKVLPTPETVPFRLTRDIEAAMGVSGVEGVLRRSCEETMVVLRNHREVIITLLQVLLYDPLFSWAITPAKAYNVQKGSIQGSSEGREASGETNKFAERALLRLDQKLRGTEEGSACSIAGQIEKLIQEARDPANLCRLYAGWQPYL